jgi:hypothetical protein
MNGLSSSGGDQLNKTLLTTTSSHAVLKSLVVSDRVHELEVLESCRRGEPGLLLWPSVLKWLVFSDRELDVLESWRREVGLLLWS